MTRFLIAGTALFAFLSSVGCCYHPGQVNPYTGTPHGGYWKPVCGGPTDPLGWGCSFGGWGRGYGQRGYGYGHRQYGYGGGYDACCEPACETGRTEPMMVPRTFQNGTPQRAPGVSPPVPDPNMSMLYQGNSGTTTYVEPQTLPIRGNRPIQRATSPAVQAF